MTSERTMPRFHPPEHVLIDYATGRASAALAVVVACHLEECPSCRQDVAILEGIGGHLLETIDPVPVSDGMFEKLSRLIDDEAAAATPHERPAKESERLPAALRAMLEGELSALPWQDVQGLFEEALLPTFSDNHRLSLLRAGKGGCVPHHDHEGDEHLLVLRGGFQSGGKCFRHGDYAFTSAGESHEPIADTDEDCLCLLMLEGSLRFSAGEIAELDARFRRT